MGDIVFGAVKPDQFELKQRGDGELIFHRGTDVYRVSYVGTQVRHVEIAHGSKRRRVWDYRASPDEAVMLLVLVSGAWLREQKD